MSHDPVEIGALPTIPRMAVVEIVTEKTDLSKLYKNVYNFVINLII